MGISALMGYEAHKHNQPKYYHLSHINRMVSALSDWGSIWANQTIDQDF
jgi:hypothetical protein